MINAAGVQNIRKLRTSEQKECPHGRTTGASKLSPQISQRRDASNVRRPGASVAGGKSVGSGTADKFKLNPFIVVGGEQVGLVVTRNVRRAVRRVVALLEFRRAFLTLALFCWCREQTLAVVPQTATTTTTTVDDDDDGHTRRLHRSDTYVSLMI